MFVRMVISFVLAGLLVVPGCKEERDKPQLKFDPPAAAPAVAAVPLARPEVRDEADVEKSRPDLLPEPSEKPDLNPSPGGIDDGTPDVQAASALVAPPPIRIIEYPDGRFRFWTFVERFGVPQGVGRVDEGTRPRRDHVEIVVSKGKVVQLHELDLSGRPLQSRDYRYRDDGRLERFVATNKMGKTVSVGQYSDGLAHYTWRSTTGKTLLQGCQSVALELDQEGYVKSRTCLGPDRVPMDDINGVTTIHYNVDLLGRVTAERYFDGTGHPCADIFGVHGQLLELNLDGLAAKTTYIDFKDNAMLHLGLGVAGVERQMNRKGQLESETYFGRAGEPMSDVRGVGGVHYGYSPEGFRVQQAFVDTAGKPARESNSGIAIVRSAYSDQGCLTSRQFFSGPDKPGAVAGRIHIERFECNPLGDIISQRFIAVDYMETVDARGIHRYLYEYSPEGMLAAVSCWSADGRGVAPKEGLPVHYRTLSYDHRLRLEEELFQGLGGKGAALWGKARGVRYRHDAWGNPVSLQFVGADSQPVDTNLGFCEERREYDTLGRLLRAEFFDVQDNPAVARKGHVSGMHRREWEYTRGPVPVRLKFYGANQEPVKARLSGRGFKGNVQALEFDAEGTRVVREKIFTDLSAMPARVLACDKGRCFDPFEFAPGR